MRVPGRRWKTTTVVTARARMPSSPGTRKVAVGLDVEFCAAAVMGSVVPRSRLVRCGRLSRVTRIRLDLAYDGTGFSGWAKQPGLRTVQGELESALATIFRRV